MTSAGLPYRVGGRDWCPTGRSTFLLPVKWIGSGDTRQPVILDKGKRVPMVLSAPKVATEVRRSAGAQFGTSGVERDDFKTAAVDPMWFQVRTPQEAWYRAFVNEKPGLEIEARPVSIYGRGNPSMLGRWVKGSTFSASVEVKFDAKGPQELAGLALYQNEQCNYVLGVTADAGGKPCVSLAKSDKDGKKAVASAALPTDGAVMLKAEAKNEVVRFFWSLDGKRWNAIGGDEDARILTTDYAGGFVGSVVGLYATTKAE